MSGGGLRGLPGWWRAFLGRPGRWWHFLLAALLVLFSLPVFAALAIAMRLWAGPIDITDAARRLLATHGVAGLTVARVRLAWNGWREGPRAPLGLQLDDVRFGRSRIGHATVALDFVELLHRRASVLALQADDAAILLRRDRDGVVALQSPSGATGLKPQPGPGRARAGSGGPLFDHLREARITHTTAVLNDGVSGLTCRANVADLLLDPLRRPAATGVSGMFEAALSCGGPGVSLHGSGREGPTGDIVWRLASSAVVPAALARAVPQLSALGALDLPVTMTMQTALSGGFGSLMVPRAMELRATLGAGTIRLPAPPAAGAAGMSAGTDGTDLPVQSGIIVLSLRLPDAPGGAIQAVLSDSVLALAGPGAPTLDFSGSGSLAGPVLRASLDGRIPSLEFAGLQRYWPSILASGARRWVTANITAGTGRNLVASAALESASGVDGLHLSRLSGSVDASGLTLFWLRPVAPLRGMDAHLVLEGPDALRIESRHAVQDVPQHGPIAVGPTSMRITGLSGKEQLGRIDARLRGTLQDLLTLLAHPRLRLLSRNPLPFTDPSGSFDARLSVSLPLADKVRIEDVAIRVDASLTGVHLGHVVAGRDLDQADLVIEAGNDGLSLQGNGVLAGVPAALRYGMDFRDGSPLQVTESAHVAAPVSAAVLQREGLDGGHRFSGQALADLDYVRRRSGAARIALQLDLTPAGIVVPGWSKPAGDAAQASGTVGLQDGQLVSIEALHAEAHGLSLDAHAEVEQGQARALALDRLVLGRSSASGRIELPAAGSGRPLAVALHGPLLDLAPFLVGAMSPGASAPSAPGGGKGLAWRTDLDFRKVLIGADRGFGMVVLHAEANGARVANARLAIGAPTRLTAQLTPEPGGRRVLLDAQDAGALLSVLGVGERIEGGVLSLRGRIADRAAGIRLNALATVGPFTVHDAPLAARLARDLSIYGFVTGAASRQLAVTRVEIPFTLEGDTLRLTDAHAYNAALGVTLRGPIDLGQGMFDLRGTLVPSYLFNALPGKLPGLGRVFSPEKGGGLLAVTVRITGPLDKPSVRVNPLSLLAPGILRRLLFD